MTVDWGSIPDWLAGVAAIAALLFAAAAARAAWEANKYQAIQIRKLEESDLRRAETDERSQADMVAAWIRMTEDATPAIVCLNGSNLPVYQFEVSLLVNGEKCDPESVRYAVKGPDVSPRILRHATSVLVDAATRALDGSSNPMDWSELYRTGGLAVVLGFVDARGRSWHRGADGILARQVQ